MSGDLVLIFLVFFPMIGGLISYALGRKSKDLRNYFAIFVCSLEFFIIILQSNHLFEIKDTTAVWYEFAGLGLNFGIDGFRYIYGAIAAFMWWGTSMFSVEYFKHYRNRNRYYMFMLITLGATLGVLFSTDLITTFIMFEVMSFASYVMVVHDEEVKTKKAADTYIAVSLFGGMIMLIGIMLVNHQLGTTNFIRMREILQTFQGDRDIIYAAAVLMMVGFGSKAGMFPIHIWLPNAHPSAPAPASALLSGILTKTGIFGAAVISTNLFLYDDVWGMGMLVFGMITMFIGAFLGLFSIDFKRTLAYSSVSQIGFIIVGLAMEGILGSNNALAVRGALLHMVNHSLIKLVLFMVAGVVYMNLHELDLNKVRGFGKNKPLLLFIFSMGALSLVGMPLWSGFISKTLLHESIVEHIWEFSSYSFNARFFQFAEGVFMLTGGLTTAYMLKLFVAIFIEDNPYTQEKNESFNKNYMSKLTIFSLIVPAIILFIFGAFPNIMDNIGKMGQEFFFGHDPAHEVDYFGWINIKGAVISFVIGFIVYFLIVRTFFITRDENGNILYIDPWPDALNLEDGVYRPLLNFYLPNVGGFIARNLGSLITKIANFEIDLFQKVDKKYIEQMDIFEERKDKGLFFSFIEGIRLKTFQSSLLQFSIALIIILILVVVL